MTKTEVPVLSLNFIWSLGFIKSQTTNAMELENAWVRVRVKQCMAMGLTCLIYFCMIYVFVGLKQGNNDNNGHGERRKRFTLPQNDFPETADVDLRNNVASFLNSGKFTPWNGTTNRKNGKTVIFLPQNISWPILITQLRQGQRIKTFLGDVIPRDFLKSSNNSSESSSDHTTMSGPQINFNGASYQVFAEGTMNDMHDVWIAKETSITSLPTETEREFHDDHKRRPRPKFLLPDVPRIEALTNSTESAQEPSYKKNIIKNHRRDFVNTTAFPVFSTNWNEFSGYKHLRKPIVVPTFPPHRRPYNGKNKMKPPNSKNTKGLGRISNGRIGKG